MAKEKSKSAEPDLDPRTAVTVPKSTVELIREIMNGFTESGLNVLPADIRGSDRIKITISSAVVLGVRTLHAVVMGKYDLVRSKTFGLPKD